LSIYIVKYLYIHIGIDKMVATDTILCATSGWVTASTPTELLNPMTGLAAVIPEGAAVKKINIYRDGDATVTTGCTIQLGTVGSSSKYISAGEGISTTALNAGHLVHKYILTDVGLAAEEELRLVLSSGLTTGSIIFEITYSYYA